MSAKFSLRQQLMLTCLGLAIIPVVFIGGFSFQQFKSFGTKTITRSYSAMEKEALETLKLGVERDRETVRALIDVVNNDARKLAASSNIISYLGAASGANKVLNNLGIKEEVRIAEGILKSCNVQHNLLEKQLQANMAVVEHLLSSHGKIRQSAHTRAWNSVNQLTGNKKRLTLPLLQFGNSLIEPNHTFSKTTIVVDQAQKLAGGTCTIFQRVNKEGDMLGIASSAKDADGNRAIATYIPARQNGRPHPLISAVLKGNTFRERSHAAGTWYLTACKPLYDANGQIAGMLQTGVREQETDDLVNSILDITIAQSGYVFVMDSDGKLVVHKRPDLRGKNVISDLKIHEFQEILNKRKAGEITKLSYLFEGNMKFLAYTYFQEWDWIICATANANELFQEAVQMSETLLKDEFMAVYHNSTAEQNGKRVPLYSQIRYIDKEGMEALKLKLGKFSNNLKPKGHLQWYKECQRLQKGEIFNSGAVIAANTGIPAMRVGAPVYINDTYKGTVVLNLDWQMVWQLLENRVYGESGYPYIINEKGEAVSHPKYNLKNPANFSDASFGDLSDLVRNHMLKGENGYGAYTFEGARKFVAFTPLGLGNRQYSIAATGPAGEFMTLADNLKTSAESNSQRVIQVISISAIALALIGTVIGLLLSNNIVRPLNRAIPSLSSGSEHVAQASIQISSASQQLAEGASRQAASLEESSSAMEELAALAKKNEESVRELSELGTRTIHGMETSHQSLLQTTETMALISASGEQMAKINKIIDEIAFQTNLLALNAAVEAARAGEAGSGFAVVADEVRNLAMRAGESARDTQTLITETLQHIGKGSELINLTLKNFSGMDEDAKKVSSLLDEVHQAVQEQTSGIDQVNTAMHEIDKIVQQNAANAEQSASASKEMNSHAEHTRDLIQELTNVVGKSDKKRKLTEKIALPFFGRSNDQS